MAILTSDAVTAYRTTINGLAGVYHPYFSAPYVGDFIGTTQKIPSYNQLVKSFASIDSSLIWVLGMIHLDPADLAASGLTPKFRTKLVMGVNSTAPTISFSAGMAPLTSPTGAANICNFTVGSTVTSSTTATITTPAANSLTTVVSSAFDVPTAGLYTVFITPSATPPAGNFYARGVVQIDLKYV